MRDNINYTISAQNEANYHYLFVLYMAIPVFIFFASQFTLFTLLRHFCGERPSTEPFILYLLLISHQSRDEMICQVTTHGRCQSIPTKQ